MKAIDLFAGAGGFSEGAKQAGVKIIWAVIAALEAKSPENAIIENVAELKRWKLYSVWKNAIDRLEYSISETIINSANYGISQTRMRLFIILTKSKHPYKYKTENKSWVPIKKIINWNYKGFKPIKGSRLSEKTLDKIERSREFYGERFLIADYGAEKIGRSIDKPCGTLTTTDKFAVIYGKFYLRLNTNEKLKIMGFPKYRLTGKTSIDTKLLENAVCPPVAKHIIEQLLS